MPRLGSSGRAFEGCCWDDGTEGHWPSIRFTCAQGKVCGKGRKSGPVFAQDQKESVRASTWSPSLEGVTMCSTPYRVLRPPHLTWSSSISSSQDFQSLMCNVEWLRRTHINIYFYQPNMRITFPLPYEAHVFLSTNPTSRSASRHLLFSYFLSPSIRSPLSFFLNDRPVFRTKTDTSPDCIAKTMVGSRPLRARL